MTCVRVTDGIICLGSPIITIRVGNRNVMFEDHRQFGPIRCNKDGDRSDRQFGPKSQFWPVWESWVDQGRRIDAEGNAILSEIPK